MGEMKLVNFIFLVVSYLVSRVTRRPVMWGKPAAASFEPTNRCNLRCPECPTGQHGLTRPPGSADISIFRSFIDQASPALSYLTLYFQGEPYLNRDLFDMTSYARNRGIFVTTSTNGHFLDPENAEKTVLSGLNRLIISVDGTTQESYEQYRIGGVLETVIKGIRNLAEARKRLQRKNPRIIIQFLVLRSNEHQINDIRKKVKEWGGDKLELKTAQFYDYEQGNPLMPKGRRFSRYAERASGGAGRTSSNLQIFKFTNPLPNHCFRMWSSCVVTWDGKVVPCCYDKDAEHVLGDLTVTPFREIWKSGVYNSFRKRILDNRKSIGICTNCMEGMGWSRFF